MSDAGHSSRRRPREPEPIIHIHEDDWGLRNVYPLAARTEVAEDLAHAVREGETNRLPAGSGWSDVHLIKSPAASYAEAGLQVADVANALAAIMPRVRRFYATAFSGFASASRDPLGSYDEDAWCFGFGRRCFVKIDPDAERVGAIWFDLTDDDSAHLQALGQALQAIDALEPSFIADYVMDAEVAIADHQALAAHLRRLSGIEAD